jgi:hypothetical protein
MPMRAISDLPRRIAIATAKSTAVTTPPERDRETHRPRHAHRLPQVEAHIPSR